MESIKIKTMRKEEIKVETNKTDNPIQEWIIAGNPSKYDVVSAFRNLGTVDWVQNANYAIGDIVYIYISAPVQALRIKCIVKQVDKKVSTIDDSKYSNDQDFSSEEYGRFTELEMIEELDGELYSRKNLDQHGFINPQRPRRVTPELKEYLDVIDVLKKSQEMAPDKHDGSYELMRSVINAYENTKDRSVIDYNDLNLVYAMAIGTWRQGIDAKKRMIELSNLPEEQKDIVRRKLDEIWRKAGNRYYENRENDGQSIGMFGTGFFSFKGKTDDVSPKNFIEMCISITHMHDSDEQVYQRCEGIVNDSLKGVQAAAVSMMLHCLKPTVFPVLNSNSDFGTIYEYLNLDVKKVRSIATYIENCRVIAKFRDENFTVKNYRIFDNAARLLKGYKGQTDIDYIGVLEYLTNNQEVPYTSPDSSNLTAERREECLQIEERGEKVIDELEKIGQLCSEKLGFDRFESGSWLDGSKTKTKKYLQLQLRKGKQADEPFSVSIFVERNGETTVFRISLEIKDDGVDKAKLDIYHKHLELDQTEGLVYVTGSNVWGRPAIIEESLEEIRAKYQAGKYRKVQPSIYINYSDDKTNDQYEEEVLSAVEKIVPYYNHVHGIDDEYWPSLEEFNPNITKEMWIKLLNDPTVTKTEYFDLLHKVLEQGGESTCAHLEEVYGGSQGAYNAYGRSLGQAVSQKLNIPAVVDEGTSRYFVFPFVGRHVTENGKARYSWKLRTELKQALQEMDLLEIVMEDGTVNIAEFDKNMILYGPPGTGKTYSSAKYAVAICDGLTLDEVSAWDYDKVLERYNELKKENRIVFTTFHQSYGYEEFIEGIKPIMSDSGEKSDIGYKVEDGVFKDFCNKASKVTIDSEIAQVGDSAKAWMVILGGSETPELAEECFEEKTIRIGWREAAEHVEEDDESLNDKERRILLNFQDEMEIGDIVVSRASATEINGIGIITGEYEFDESNPRYPRKRNIDWLYTGEKINILNLNGETRLDRKSVYPLGRIKPNDLLKLIPSEEVVLQNETRPYVFIIDEINRGNISKIFGELITLIESTKRKGAEEAMEVILPYSGDSFSVPNNVYILGTMNTADRSIALMDTALRRRFGFAEMMPDAKLLDGVNIEDKGESLNIGQMLRIINDRITFLYDREHTIGHAFFMKLVKGGTVNDLAAIFEKSVVPLLQEYFYEDYEKIRLVLGDSAKKDRNTQFIQVEEIPDDLFDVDVSETIDISEEKNYTIAYENFKNIMTYKGISNKL